MRTKMIYFITVLVILISCKKDNSTNSSFTQVPQDYRTPYIGDYNCSAHYSFYRLDTPYNYQIDTNEVVHIYNVQDIDSTVVIYGKNLIQDSMYVTIHSDNTMTLNTQSGNFNFSGYLKSDSIYINQSHSSPGSAYHWVIKGKKQ